MKFKLFCFVSVFFMIILGLKVGAKTADAKVSSSHAEFPLTEHKSFAVVVYGYNQADWCERSLRSVVSQDYDHFRVIFIDDASLDKTKERVEAFILDQSQQHRISLLSNASHLGETASLYRVIETLLDREIVLPIRGKDWLIHPNVLQDLNRAYQNPDVWLSSSFPLIYPTYEMQPASPIAFYAALFKQIQLCDLMRSKDYLAPLKQLAGQHIQALAAPLVFENMALPTPSYLSSGVNPPYLPLDQFPKVAEMKKEADILIFSCDRPLQLYACLESIHRYMKGFHTLSVLYRASQEKFAAAYKQLEAAFPQVRFLSQSKNYKKDFKPLLMKAVFNSPSPYILFGVDDIIVKDFTHLASCMEQMEKTGAYGFYLRFGKHISYCYQAAAEQSVPLSIPLAEGMYAWSLDQASYDWGFPNSLDMTLYRKKDLKKIFEELKFKTPNSLEFCWAKEARPKGAIGLYFENSKIVNIPFNVVSRTGNPHMNYLTVDELLVKFEEGLKMNIDPLYKIANSSPHFEYLPQFISR